MPISSLLAVEDSPSGLEEISGVQSKFVFAIIGSNLQKIEEVTNVAAILVRGF